MELKFSKMEKIVGVFILCIAALLATTVVVIGRGKDWFKTYVTYYAIFDESYNLQENAPVKLYKADIGRLKEINLVGDKVELRLAILEQYAPRIRKDAAVTVESPTLIGSEYIALRPGTNQAEAIPEGGRIPSKEKKTISDYLDEFEVEKTARMLIEAVQDLSEVAKALRDPDGALFTSIRNIRATTGHIERITGDLQEGKGTAGNLLKSDELINAINAKVDRVGDILDHVADATGQTPDAMQKVRNNLDTVQEIGDRLVLAVDDIRKTIAEVDEAVESLKVTLSNIEQGSYDVPEITRSTKQGIAEIRDGVKNIDDVVESLKNNFLIRPNLPPEPVGGNVDAGLRQ